MGATASKIAAGDLSQRIRLHDTESELGRLAGILNSTFARLEAAFAQQGRFVCDAAHELRTPLAVLLTQIQTAVAHPRQAAEYQGALEACQRTAQRMRRLVESLLELARFDSGQEPIQRRPFSLTRMIRDCLGLLEPLARQRAVRMHADLPELDYEGDADRLAQAVTNLLTNAIDYSREGGQVSVAAQQKDGFVVIEVQDTGPGIAPQHLPHLFERFYRVDPSRSSGHGHTGLGLAIAKAIVEAHGGSLEATSRLGEGSILTLRLPRAEAARMSAG
jgi:heavy metal sensor kinase